MRHLAALAFVSGASGCGTRTVEVYTTPESRGEGLVGSTSLSLSRFNAFTCTTCHAKIETPVGRILPGAPLAGASARPSFWGGRFLSLGDAVDECLTHFMRGKALDRTSNEARDLYGYLASISEKGSKDAQPFTVVVAITDLPKSDAPRGETLWASSCAQCHGAPHTGAGRIVSASGQAPASLVPEDTLDYHGADGPVVVRQVVIEKVRHGSFLGFPGNMPPFSRERLTDAQVADIVTYLGLYP